MPSKLTSSLRSIIACATVNPIFEVQTKKGGYETFVDADTAQQFAEKLPGCPKVLRRFEVDIPQVADEKHYLAWKNFAHRFGGRWISARNTHLFDRNPSPIFETILKDGIIPDWNPDDFYPTPIDLATSILDIGCVKEAIDWISQERQQGNELRILEPSFGEGVFGSLIADRVGTKQCILPIEIDSERVELTRLKGFSTIQADFLEWSTDERFPLIIMNPPFNGLEWLKHIKHAFGFLRKGGLLVSIIPYEKAKVKPENLRWLAQYGDIEENPPQAFKASGTVQSTAVVFMENTDISWKRKPSNGYPSFDAELFDITVSSDGAKYRILENLFARICSKLDQQHVGSATYETLSDEDQQLVCETIQRLNDAILSESFKYSDLQDTDLRFLCNSWIENWCETHDIRYCPRTTTCTNQAQLDLELVA